MGAVYKAGKTLAGGCLHVEVREHEERTYLSRRIKPSSGLVRTLALLRILLKHLWDVARHHPS